MVMYRAWRDLVYPITTLTHRREPDTHWLDLHIYLSHGPMDLLLAQSSRDLHRPKLPLSSHNGGWRNRPPRTDDAGPAFHCGACPPFPHPTSTREPKAHSRIFVPIRISWRNHNCRGSQMIIGYLQQTLGPTLAGLFTIKTSTCQSTSSGDPQHPTTWLPFQTPSQHIGRDQWS